MRTTDKCLVMSESIHIHYTHTPTQLHIQHSWACVSLWWMKSSVAWNMYAIYYTLF